MKKYTFFSRGTDKRKLGYLLVEGNDIIHVSGFPDRFREGIKLEGKNLQDLVSVLHSQGVHTEETEGPSPKTENLAKAEDRHGLTTIPLHDGYTLHHDHTLTGKEADPLLGEGSQDEWRLHSPEGIHVGRFSVATDGSQSESNEPRGSKGPTMAYSNINGEHQGLGLGAAAYKALADHYGSLMSDTGSTSDDAHRVWESDELNASPQKERNQQGARRYKAEGDTSKPPIMWSSILKKSDKLNDDKALCAMFMFKDIDDPDIMHVTHKYFPKGSVNQAEVIKSIKEFFKEHPFKPFKINLDKLDFFGKDNDYRVLRPSTKDRAKFLLDLKKKLDTFSKDTFPYYKPHATVNRNMDEFEGTVDAYCLYKGAKLLFSTKNLTKSELLEKGKNGDWKKEGYTLKHVPHAGGDSSYFEVHAFAPDGTKVGSSEFQHHTNGKNIESYWDGAPYEDTNTAVSVDKEHQRKGLASGMYHFAEEVSGKSLRNIRPNMRTESGRALWSQPNRSFGSRIKKSLRKSEPLKKDVVRFARPTKQVDTRNPDEKYEDAVARQENSRTEQKRNNDFERDSELSPEIQDWAIQQMESSGYNDIADKLKNGSMSPRQAADILEDQNHKGVAAALRSKKGDDFHTLQHAEQAHNDFDLNGRDEQYDDERQGALDTKYLANRQSRDVHFNHFRNKDCEISKFNNNQTPINAMLYMHANGLENSPTANDIRAHMTDPKNKEHYSNEIKQSADFATQKANEYAAGPKDEKDISFEKENPGFHQRVSTGYTNKATKLGQLHSSLGLNKLPPKLKLMKSLKKSLKLLNSPSDAFKTKHPMASGMKVHSDGHTRDEAHAKATELRTKGTEASVWHMEGPKTGPKSKYAVTVPESHKLEKGLKGDWQKEGYSLQYKAKQFGKESSPVRNHIVTAYHKDGSEAGTYHLEDLNSNDPASKLNVVDSFTVPKHRRKGLASAAYRLAEVNSGKHVSPLEDQQSEDASLLWSQPERKFGKSKPLAKGSRQAKIPFNPQTDVSDAEKRTVREWQNEEGERLKIPSMSPEAKSRAIDKLMSKTTYRRNPETKELEFLLHRGMSGSEFKDSTKNKVVSNKQRTSWTPRLSTAKDFARKYENDSIHPSQAASAWITESDIHHIPSQIGSTGFEHQGKNIYSQEHEVIVKPHTSKFVPYQDAENMSEQASADSPDINERINARHKIKTEASDFSTKNQRLKDALRMIPKRK